MSHWKTWLAERSRGVLMTSIVAIAAMALASHYGAPVMLFALLLGMAVNFLSQDSRCKPGIEFTARQVLRWGVALLGLKITVAQVQAMGWQPLAMVVTAVAATIGFGILAARLLGFQKFFGLLTGGAVGICGASAALAISAAFPQHPQKERATLFTVIGVSTLSTIAMVLYPVVVRLLGLDALNAGFFLGGTIHDVAQVVGAGYSMGPETGDAATVIKLMRVAMLVPVIALAAWMTHRHNLSQAAQAQQAGALQPARPPLLPGFAVAFVVLVAVNSLGWVPPTASRAGLQMSQAFLVAAMAAIGMKTHLKDILTVGWRPVALMVLETLFLAALFFGLMWAAGLHAQG
ncbi:YeiH family protein [Curvibacter gracilis]|uniref:YeiH family protein n=1 Tax=Curvibacter gracilis TaxID=230310 RepID=UPI000489936D|nr:putative sulfate exporter family transporter [Curvibacter gracilis]